MQLNLAMTWLQPQMLVMRQKVSEADIYQVLKIEPVAVWLQNKYPEGNNSIVQLLRVDVENNFIPCTENGTPLKMPEVSPSIKYVSEHLYQGIKEVAKNTIAIEFIRKSSNEFNLQTSLDDKFDQVFDRAMEPVLDYLISCCDWDSYVAESLETK